MPAFRAGIQLATKAVNVEERLPHSSGGWKLWKQEFSWAEELQQREPTLFAEKGDREEAAKPSSVSVTGKEKLPGRRCPWRGVGGRWGTSFSGVPLCPSRSQTVVETGRAGAH